MVTEKLKTASENYQKGYTCSQAVISVFACDIGINEQTAYRLFESFGSGFGVKQEVCGAFSAVIKAQAVWMEQAKQIPINPFVRQLIYLKRKTSIPQKCR